MAKKAKKVVRREYTKADVKELRAHSKARTPIARITKLTAHRRIVASEGVETCIRFGHHRSVQAVARDWRTSRTFKL
jgi:hypothetical protein